MTAWKLSKDAVLAYNLVSFDDILKLVQKFRRAIAFILKACYPVF